jgi:hypothetical protein
MAFKDDGYETYRRIVDPEVLELLSNQVQLYRDWVYATQKTDKNDKFAFKDGMVENSFTINSDTSLIANGTFIFEGLLQMLKPKMEKLTGLELLPTYACSRIYYPGAVMARHVDRPSCEVSATLCVELNGDIWPIWVQNKQKTNIPVYLKAGDMLVYRGLDIPHWRNAYTEGTKQIQVFMHYVDKNGPYANFAYDGRTQLGVAYGY